MKYPLRRARKLVLPKFELTESCEPDAEGATKIRIPEQSGNLDFYERRRGSGAERVPGALPVTQSLRINLYPVVLEASGLPWTEANIYILSRVSDSLRPTMSTFERLADDLVAYRRFLDDELIDWKFFPKQKLSRPTYRYSAHLQRSIAAGSISPTSAKRRISAIVGFYRWLSTEGLVIPQNPAWKESDLLLSFTGHYGQKITQHATTTDLSLRVPNQNDPYDGSIADGGKLRPLSLEQQGWIVEAAFSQGNTEMALIHLIALTTGARIQTILTFRAHTVKKLAVGGSSVDPEKMIRCPVGPGTGIDTKNDKLMSLHIPGWVCNLLLTYTESPRAYQRRRLSKCPDDNNQYLFLSRYGAPFYTSKEDSVAFDPANNRRHAIRGQSIRKYISEEVIAFVRKKYDNTFSYQFHDLRATFGMNLTKSQLYLVNQGGRTLDQVREYVKVRMGHESAATTDLYLQFQGNLDHVLRVIDDHEHHLKRLVEAAKKL